MSKIIAVCPKEYPGVNAVFRHGAALGLWTHLHLEDTIPENDFVILGAWHPSYEEYLDKHRCVVYLTSTFGQMEFSNNQIEIQYIPMFIELLNKNRIKAILAGWKEVADYFNDRVKEKSFYCPYPFSEAYLKEIKEGAFIKEPNSVGIFLPCAPRKNTFNQLLAAVKSGMKIYTNLPYNFENPNINKIEWLSNEEYFLFISRLTLTLHCTFTESFSYAAAESLMLGTLPIVSLQISENLNLPHNLICYQCDSVSNILSKIEGIKELDEFRYEEHIRSCQGHFRFKNKINFALTKDVLDKVTNLVVK